MTAAETWEFPSTRTPSTVRPRSDSAADEPSRTDGFAAALPLEGLVDGFAAGLVDCAKVTAGMVSAHARNLGGAAGWEADRWGVRLEARDAELSVAEGTGGHLDRGYVYFAMAFALGVELINLRLRSKQGGVTLREPPPVAD